MDFSRNCFGLELPNWKDAKDHEKEICNELANRLKAQTVVVFKSKSKQMVVSKHKATLEFCKELASNTYPPIFGLRVSELAIRVVEQHTFFKILPDSDYQRDLTSVAERGTWNGTFTVPDTAPDRKVVYQFEGYVNGVNLLVKIRLREKYVELDIHHSGLYH